MTRRRHPNRDRCSQNLLNGKGESNDDKRRRMVKAGVKLLLIETVGVKLRNGSNFLKGRQMMTGRQMVRNGNKCYQKKAIF